MFVLNCVLLMLVNVHSIVVVGCIVCGGVRVGV